MDDAILVAPRDMADASPVSNLVIPLSRPQPGKGAILVMDDDDAIRHLLSIMLDALGYTSVRARA